MKPGDIVRSKFLLGLYSDENLKIFQRGIPKDSIGTVLSPPKRNFVKLLVGGDIGWVNWTLLDVQQ